MCWHVLSMHQVDAIKRMHAINERLEVKVNDIYFNGSYLCKRLITLVMVVKSHVNCGLIFRYIKNFSEGVFIIRIFSTNWRECTNAAMAELFIIRSAVVRVI